VDSTPAMHVSTPARLLVPIRKAVQPMLVQRQCYCHTGSRGGGRIDDHLSASKDYGHSHEAQSRAGVPTDHGCRHVETTAIVGHFELNAVAHALGDAAQPESHS